MSNLATRAVDMWKLRGVKRPASDTVDPTALAALRRAVDLGNGPATGLHAHERHNALRGLDAMAIRHPSRLATLVADGSYGAVCDLIAYGASRR